LAYHKLQPERVFEVMNDFDRLMDQWHARMLGDNLSAEEEHIWTANEIVRRQVAVGYQLIAARLAAQPERATPLKPFIERELPSTSGAVIEEQYWHSRARLAALEGRKAAALTYYQKALQARPKPPEPYEGHLQDTLGDEARALWDQLEAMKLPRTCGLSLPLRRSRKRPISVGKSLPSPFRRLSWPIFPARCNASRISAAVP
jgi:hypothetical protein